jgi:hypothetical protein
MSKFQVACRRTATATTLLLALALGCDDDAPPPAPDSGSGGSGGGGGKDAGPDAAGGSGGGADGPMGGDGPRDLTAADAPPQDLTPVMIQRPIVVRKGTRLRGMFVQSAEGAQERWALWDSQLNVRCSVSTSEDGKWRCLPVAPSSWAVDSYFARFIDAGCSEPALPEATACASSLATKVVAGGRAIHRLGPVAEVSTLYTRVTVNGVSTCEARPLPAPKRFFTYGERLDPAMFVERLAVRTDGPQTQRIRPVYDELADGTRVMTTILDVWDADLEAYCRVYTADDGWLRCLPNAVMIASSVYFSDDRCTKTAALSQREMPEKFAVYSEGTGCQARRRVFKADAAAPRTPH